MEGKMHIQYSCTFRFVPPLWPQRKREWPVRGRNTTWKILRKICKPLRSAYRRPWCKVSSTWNYFFFFSRSRSSGRTHKTWRDWHAEGNRTVAWRNEESVEEIGEKKFLIDIWVLHGNLDTGCVHIFWNQWDRKVSVTDTTSILIECKSINEVGHWEFSAFFIPNKLSVL
jgi:hypothetical protein